MRVLAVCVDSPGHVNPLLPLLMAMAAQGDDVVVASGPGAVGLVTAAGLRSRVVGRGFDGWFADLRARTRGTPGDGLPPERIEHYFLPRLFGEIGAADMIDALMGAAADAPPDLVVFESYAYAASLAAGLLGVPAAGLQVGFRPPEEVVASVADALSPLWCQAGRRVDRDRSVFGDLHLRTAPASLEHGAAPVRVMTLRPTGPPAAGPRPAQPPLVHVTAGTAPHRDLDVLRRVVEALADEPVQVAVAVGSDASPDWARDVPANTTVEGYVSYAELLPRCSVVLHHGGAGTMYAALAHGLPAVVTPSGADQFANAARIQAAGAGVVLDSGALTADAIRTAVRTALRDDAMRARARRDRRNARRHHGGGGAAGCRGRSAAQDRLGYALTGGLALCRKEPRLHGAVRDGTVAIVKEVGRRRRNQPAPPHVVFEALSDPDRPAARRWLVLVDDE